DLLGNTSTASTTVNVASKVVSRRDGSIEDGYSYTTKATNGICHVDRDAYNRTAQLDCWGGNYAMATYRLHIPPGAHGLNSYVTGARGCCSQGQLTFTGTRTSPTSYLVKVKVTNWRS